MNLQSLILKSQSSSFYRWLLNRILWRMIPFNKPHRFMLSAIKPGSVTVSIPYIRSNKNHINGIHACALATASEYASGLCLATLLPDSQYRILLKNLNMDYFYQGKTAVTIEFSITENFLHAHILQPLSSNDSIFVPLEIKSYDASANHISTCYANWQVKNWRNVRTKV